MKIQSLTKVLQQNIKPKDFKEKAHNYYFLVWDDEIRIAWEDINQVFNGFYFNIIVDYDDNTLESYISEYEITIKEIYEALKELEWI